MSFGKIKKAISIALLMALLSGMTAACNAGQAVDISRKNEVRIGVAYYMFNDTFISTVKTALEEFAKEKSAKTGENIIITSVDGQGQQEIQNDQIDNFIAQKYDVIAVNMVDRMAASVIIDKAKAAGIPIVFFNREPVREDMAKWDRMFYVGAKAEESGMMQGQIAAEYWKIHPEADINKDGVIQYVMLEGEPGHQDAILRTEYAIKALDEAGVRVEKLACDTANWQRAQGKEKMLAWLSAFGNRIEMVLSNNDDMALGAIEALKGVGYFKNNKYMPVISVDATPPALEAIARGELAGTVLNDAKGQAKGIFDIAYAFTKTEDPARLVPNIIEGKYLWIPYQPFTKDNKSILK